MKNKEKEKHQNHHNSSKKGHRNKHNFMAVDDYNEAGDENDFDKKRGGAAAKTAS